MLIVPCVAFSASKDRVMTNPEITKNTSTPTKPPGIQDLLRWKIRTNKIATARNPWISEKNFGSVTAPLFSINLPFRAHGFHITSLDRFQATPSTNIYSKRDMEAVRLQPKTVSIAGLIAARGHL
jgi:hypothetical protein